MICCYCGLIYFKRLFLTKQSFCAQNYSFTPNAFAKVSTVNGHFDVLGLQTEFWLPKKPTWEMA
jgi:hypothetical protein